MTKCANQGRLRTHLHSPTELHILDCSAFGLCVLEDAGAKDRAGNAIQVCDPSCPRYEEPTSVSRWKCDVVVTSHNYGRFLAEALDSAINQRGLGKLIVVDDASDPGDEAKAICEACKIEYIRTEFQSPHLARGAGLAKCRSPLVMFLDADNWTSPDYLREAAALFDANSRLAIVYPDLQDFGDRTELRTMLGDVESLERENFIDTGAVWRREAIDQLNAFERSPAGVEDWWLAREIARSGKWEIAKNPIPLNYRRHEGQRIQSIRDWSYKTRAGLAGESVTVFTTFSQRIQQHPELWERRKAWLRSQTWPNVRLVVANTSHAPFPPGWMDGLQMASMSFYEHPVGFPGLEDQLRHVQRVEESVQTTVAAIYNRMWQETRDEFVLILEDDVFPESENAIEQLMAGFDHGRVCAVSGAYQQRYHPYAWTAWRSLPENGRPKLLPNLGKGVESIAGTGFGCLLLRRSQCSHEVITGNTMTSRYYDADLFGRLKTQGRDVRINWNVLCDHAGEKIPPPPSATSNAPCIHRGKVIRREKCELCGTTNGPKGTLVDISQCDIHGECAASRYKAGQRAQSCSTCPNFAPLVQLTLSSHKASARV